METEGLFAPATAAAARERYERLEPAARTVVKETATALEIPAEEYQDRVTEDVVETARDALFASLLEVRVGTRSEYEDWLAEAGDLEVTEVGSEHVEHVVWHHAPLADAVVAATYADKRAAAVGTLRRQAFGRLYSEVV